MLCEIYVWVLCKTGGGKKRWVGAAGLEIEILWGLNCSSRRAGAQRIDLRDVCGGVY